MPEKITIDRKLSREAFRRKAAEIVGRLKMAVPPFADASPAAKKARLERSRQSPFFFFETYLPHYFTSPCAPFHFEIVDLVDRRPAEAEVVTPVVVAAPREFAKTTIVSFGYVLHQICHGLRHFVIIGSDTEDLASDLTGYLYLELLYNERLKADFGELVRDGIAVDDFVTANDVRLKARGRGQRVRGLKHKQWRPDLFIADDLENDKSVKNPRLVKELLDWLARTVYPAIDSQGSLLWIGTILARRSALAIAVKGEEEPWQHWTRRIYRALQEDGSSLWPERHPVEKLLAQKEKMGTLAFNQEKQNDPKDEEGAFQEEWIRYYHPDELRGKELYRAGWFDASMEVKATSDYKAIVTVGLDRRDMVVYVLDAFIQRVSLDRAILAVLNRHRDAGFHIFGIEDNLFQKLLLREFDRAMQERGVLLPIRGVTNIAAKESRILRLSPYVERGRIRFCRGQGDQDLLIEQLLYFPSPTVHDDGPDALEGAVRLAEGAAGGLFDFYRREFERLQEKQVAHA